MHSIAPVIGFVLLGSSLGCQILVDGDLSLIHCEEKNVVGAPACPERQFCHEDLCRKCRLQEICWDEADNDCDDKPDDGCDKADGGLLAPYDRVGKFSSERAHAKPVHLYTFLEGEGDLIHDVAGRNPPLALKLPSAGYRWLERGGLRLDGPRSIESQGDAVEFYDVPQGAFSIEVWFWNGKEASSDFGSILSMSKEEARNFSLGTQDGALEFRVHTANASGIPGVRGNLNPSQTVHAVVVREAAGTIQVYVNKVLVKTMVSDLSPLEWDRSLPLFLGNEGGGAAPWQGEIYLVAMYHVALQEAQVAQNYEAGRPRWW